jgi:hypothetical protein
MHVWKSTKPAPRKFLSMYRTKINIIIKRQWEQCQVPTLLKSKIVQTSVWLKFLKYWDHICIYCRHIPHKQPLSGFCNEDVISSQDLYLLSNCPCLYSRLGIYLFEMMFPKTKGCYLPITRNMGHFAPALVVSG